MERENKLIAAVLQDDLEQMARGVLHLLQYACGKIHERQIKKQASGVVQVSRWLSQGLVQISERHVFLPGLLVGEGQVHQGKARYILLAWRDPFQRGPGTL